MRKLKLRSTAGEVEAECVVIICEKVQIQGPLTGEVEAERVAADALQAAAESNVQSLTASELYLPDELEQLAVQIDESKGETSKAS